MRSTAAGRSPIRGRAAWLLLALGAGAGAAPAAEAPIVQLVAIESVSERLDRDELARWVSVEAGAPLDPEAVRDTLRAFRALGGVAEVEAWALPVAGGVELRFVVASSPRVEAVRFVGDLRIRESELRREVPQRAGAPLSESRVVRGLYRLQDLYTFGGYLDATVRLDVELDDSGQLATVAYEIAGGDPARIAAVEFDGDLGELEAADLTAVLRVGPGGRLREDWLREDLDRLESWLVERGFRQATVERPRRTRTPEGVKLVYPLQLGPRFEIEVVGAEVKPLQKRGLLPILGAERYDEGLLLETVEGLRRHYQERGHYRVAVTPRESGEEVRRLRIEIAPGPVYALERLTFTGNETLSAATLGQLMTTAAGRKLSGKARLADAVLAEDLSNLRSYYALQGFDAAQVGPPRIDERGSSLAVEVPIVEGRRRRVVELRIAGDPAVEEGRLRDLLALEPGGPFHPRRLEDSLEALRAFYQEEGYHYAQVGAAEAWSEDGALVDLTIGILAGPQSVVDRVIIRGNTVTRERLVRRVVELERGEPVSTRKLLEAQRRLYGLGVFSSVSVKLAPGTPFGSRRDVMVQVEEGKTRRISYGLGYDSEAGLRGLFGVSRQNLGGRAVTARLDLRQSQDEYEYRALVRQPFLGRFNQPVTYSLFALREERESFDSLREGAQVQARRLRRGREIGLTYRFERVDTADEKVAPLAGLDPVNRDLRQIEISTLSPFLRLDRRDDPVSPTRGWATFLQAEYALPFPSTRPEHLKLFAQHTSYLSLGRTGVLVVSARAGAIEPLGDERFSDPITDAARSLDGVERPGLALAGVPISERFFAGGRSTHRAYERDRLGIPCQTIFRAPAAPGADCATTLADPEAGPLVYPGGNGLFLVNLDYRFPIVGLLGGTVFADSGNVWADWADVRAGDFRTGVGVGLRYLSPLGPLRLEIGWKLDRNRELGESPSVVLFSFGYPF